MLVPARQFLAAWLSTVTKRSIRLMETSQSSKLPSGRLLRGITLVPDELVLGRDKLFYRPHPQGAIPLTLDEVLEITSYAEIREAFREAQQVAKTRRHAS